MRRCKNCQMTILDPTLVCPLCHSVLETDSQQQDSGDKKTAGMYPNVKNVARKLNFVMKLYTFLAIVAETALVIINYVTFSGLWWSAISGAGILYFYVTLRYSILKNSGYLKTILNQLVFAVLLTIAVDLVVGYRGWSVNYVLPSAILFMDLTIFILMLVNLSNWQSYILLQLLTVVLSIMVLIFWKAGIIWHPVVTLVAASVSGVMFIGTLIFGDRRAKNELKRRFHI